MTKRQQETLDWIRKYFISYSTGPRLTDIATALGISSPSALDHVRSLLERKRIIREGDRYTPAGYCPTCGQGIPKPE